MSGIHMALLGGGGDVITLLGIGLFDSEPIAPGTAAVGYRLSSGGEESYAQGSPTSYTPFNTWCSPPTSAPNYEARITVNSGVAPTGGDSVGTWVALSSTRSWELSRSTAGTATNNLTVEIRLASTGDVVASATVTMTVEVGS